MTAANVFCIKDAKNFAALLFFSAACNTNSSGQMRQISRRMEMIHPTIGWRRDEHGTHKHAHGSWILWSVSRVRSKTMHSLSCITSWLPYITLCYIDSRFFLPLEQSRTALLGCRLASSRGCLLAIGGKLLQLSAYQQARWPFCKLWVEHRFSVPDLVSNARRVHTTHENYTV